MVNSLFSDFPTVDYRIGSDTFIASNITIALKIEAVLRSRGSVIYNYTVKDEDRPDLVANSFYQDSFLDWIILLTNRVINPVWEWPISSLNFPAYLESKYGTYSAAHQTVHEYRQITEAERYSSDGRLLPARTVVIDQTEYNALPAYERQLITKAQYEEELNESRRNILVLHSKYIPSIVREKKALVAL